MALSDKQLFSVVVIIAGLGFLYLTDELALGPGGAEKAYQRGVEYAKDSLKTDMAMRQFDLAIQRDPAMTKAYFARAYQNQRRSRLDEALADYDAVIRLKPDYDVAYFNRGLIYADIGNPQRALTDFSAAIGAEPTKVSYYFSRAGLYRRTGELDRALADYDAVIAKNPKDTKAYFERSSLRADNGDFDGAVADLDKVAAIVPGLFVTYLERGRLRRAKGDATAALEDFNTAIGLKGDNEQSYIERAITYRDREQIDKAKAEFDDIIKRFPNNAAAYLNRGLLRLFLLNQPAAAAEDFVTAIDRGNSFRILLSLTIEAAEHFHVEVNDDRSALLSPIVPFFPTIYYLAIWRHIARVHDGQDDKAEFTSIAQRWDIDVKLPFDKPPHESRSSRRAYWPTHIMGLHLGLTTPEVVRNAVAATPGSYKRHLRECEAIFYFAEYKLEQGGREDAHKLLQAAADNCPSSAPEAGFAKAELRRLGM